MKEIILQSVLYSEKYGTFLEHILETLEEVEVSELLIQILFSHFKSTSAIPAHEAVKSLVQKKCSHEGFAQVFLSNSDAIISELLGNDRLDYRSELVQLINTSLVTAPSFTLIKHICSSDFLLPNWVRFDDIFQPVYFYISTIDANHNDILESFFELITTRFITFFNEIRREIIQCASRINITHVFKTILHLIRNFHHESVYIETVLSPDFLSRWASSPFHSHAFSDLISHFLCDNESQTDSFLNFVSSLTDRTLLATLFTMTCEINDHLADRRVDFLFNSLPLANWESPDLATFIRTVAQTIRPSACESLINHQKQWLIPWVITGDKGVRRAGVDLIYALFPQFPKHWKDPPPEPSETDRDILTTLTRSLVSQLRQTVDLAKSRQKSGEWPTDTYFEVLGWAIHHSELKLDDWGSSIHTMCEILSKIGSAFSEKRGILDAIRFLGNLKPCLSQSAFATILTAIDRFPADPTDWSKLIQGKPASSQAKEDYLNAIMADFLSFIAPHANAYGALILKSAAMRALMPTFTWQSTAAFCQVARDLESQDNCRKIIHEAILDPDIFPRHMEAQNQPYRSLVWWILRDRRGASLFAEKCAKILITSLRRETFSTERTLNGLQLLGHWSAKYSKSSLTKFWFAEKQFLELLFSVFSAKDIPLPLLLQIVAFFKGLFTASNALTAIVLPWLEGLTVDFFRCLHQQCRLAFAEMTVSVALEPGNLKLAADHLVLLSKLDIFDAKVLHAYIGVLERVDVTSYARDLVPFFGRFFDQAKDLECFRCGMLAVKLARKAEMMELCASWSALCFSLVDELCSTISVNIETNEAVTARSKLVIADDFLKLLAICFPPSPKYQVLAEDLQKSEDPALVALGKTINLLMTKTVDDDFVRA